MAKPPRLTLVNVLLFILIATYTIYFSWYTINRHNTLNSYAADLSLIDQPMWNTVLGPGGYMEQTWGDRQQPRLAEHFEPILIPLAFLFFLWDDVRILLIAQSLALALGALPVFWIARDQLKNSPEKLQKQTTSSRPNLSDVTYGALSRWAALIFAGVYLLSPHLQAANIADFHADPFVVTPLLFAFWYASQKQWRWMWLWAIIAMLVKENLPTLTAMLGLYLMFDYSPTKWKRGGANVSANSQVRHGLGLILVSTAWFLIATFLIVGPLARQYFGTDGPIYLASRFDGTLNGLFQDPARGWYLVGLLASVGFLPLLAPEVLILGLPILAANLLSNFPGQYSGEQHYSAPLVVAFIIAAIYGARRLIRSFSLREVTGQPLRITSLLAVLLWLLAWSLGYHTLHGWTPFSIRTETYSMTPAAALVPTLIDQIPAEAVVSASAGIHPHLAHRRVVYVFPTVEEAEYLLIDVTDIPGVHPFDARTAVEKLLRNDWQLLEAKHGLIFAQKSARVAAQQPNTSRQKEATGLLLKSELQRSQPRSCAPNLNFPCEFYAFAHASKLPDHPAPLTFGDNQLHLLGYDVLDDRDDGLVVRFYWQVENPLPADVRLWPLIYDDYGRLLSDPTQIPMIATVWYPPSTWSASQVIVTETLPQHLPDTFHLGLAAGLPNGFGDPARRLPVTPQEDAEIWLHPGHWAQLASFQRQGYFLVHQPPLPSFQQLQPTDVQFGPSITLTGYRFERLQPTSLAVRLMWQAAESPSLDYTVFVHLLGPDGSLVSQSDAVPTWLTPQPTSRWQPGHPILDSHMLPLPPDLPPAAYTLQIGLYDPQTLERLTRPDGANVVELGSVYTD